MRVQALQQLAIGLRARQRRWPTWWQRQRPFAHLEAQLAQLEAFKAHSHELQQLCADIDDDLAFDSESAPLSETGVRNAESCGARYAKRKKDGEIRSVVSRLGAA